MSHGSVSFLIFFLEPIAKSLEEDNEASKMDKAQSTEIEADPD